MKKCTACREPKPFSEFFKDKRAKDGHYSKCKPCHTSVQLAWRARHPENVVAHDKRTKFKNADSVSIARSAYHRAHRDERLVKQKLRYQALKDKAYAAYGGYRCRCCGEVEKAFLCLDHVNNDGHAHRKIVPPASLYMWLKVHGYPPIFQVLCANCNLGKRINNGVCPHQRQLRAIA